ncbi:MAG: hypothetical protein WD042_01610 [Phycisphaeraceae bacterium]
MWHVSVGIVAVLVLGASAQAVVLDQVDDFQDGTVAAWAEGISSPNPPVNIATGGPAGAGDRYLELVSSGVPGAGGRQVMFNQAQWAGDYVTAGVNRITGRMNNFGPSDLAMRLAFTTGDGTIYVSTNPVNLPSGGGWQAVSFDLTPDGLSLASGTSDLATALSDITELRILSSAAGGTVLGDELASTLGVDNLHATVVPEPAALTLAMAGVLVGMGRRGRETLARGT